ncbi:L,D-transpeptidase [Corynebacterium sp. H130]|uniref:L,D-transpeptidase n=1 Tax=Corynebacterium sp. H130 TaxID=3133444 RepID=UPI0030B06920
MSKHRKPSAFKRRASIAASAAVAAVAVMSQPALAATNGSSEFQAGSSDFAAEAAWNARNAVYNSTAGLPPAQRDALRKAADDNLRFHFPGLLESKLPAPAPAPAPAPEPAPAPTPAPEIDRGSCPPQARACLDKAGNRAWLQHGGEITYGPVPVSHGAPGWETPSGTFYVTRKVKDEISYEFNNAPMPNSVYFTNNGIAFHAGRIDWLSHGCVHLQYDDSAAFFNDLQLGEMVYVY